MNTLLRINWSAHDTRATIKVAVGLVIMLALEGVTGETWLATALAAMCAWLTNVPGATRFRVAGMTCFGVGALAATAIAGQVGLALGPNIALIAIVGFFGTSLLARGTRPFMVGFSLVTWAIYAPLLIENSSTANCLLAVMAGTGIVVVLNVASDAFREGRGERADSSELSDDAQAASRPPASFVLAYASSVAIVLAATTYAGWTWLETDPTIVTAGAFFVIGFDVQKTLAAGVGRLIGLAAGVAAGLGLAHLIGPGLVLDGIAILACGLSFGAMAMHPGAWMFFFMIFVSIGWHSLQSDVFAMTALERFSGESAGAITAIASIAFLERMQARSAKQP